MSVTDQVRLLEAELATLRERQGDVDALVAAEVRRAYRRGYGTGYAAGRARADRESAPERHARTHVRRALERGSVARRFPNGGTPEAPHGDRPAHEPGGRA